MDSKSYKQLKRRQSRQIRAETNDPNLRKDGILNVSEFLKSRKFEITELEKAQLKAKFASSTRTFQSLPRTLRRRTASHNVKRIPKRLRKRAIREMQSDTGTTPKKSKLKGRDLYRARTASALLRLAARAQLNKQLPNDKTLSLGKLKMRQRIKLLKAQLKDAKEGNFISLNNTVGSYDNSTTNTLAEPPMGKMKYTKRQREFVWLNSHVWHAKRAHMIKRWGWQIPLKPTQKAFRSSHRAFHLDGAIVWDKSYIGTMMLQSDNQESLKALLEKLIGEQVGKKIMNYGSVTKKLCYGDAGVVLGDVVIISFFKAEEETKKVVLRLHPAIYTKVFDQLINSKTEDVEVVDNRYAIGSIELCGPISLSALATVLKPYDPAAVESKLFGKLCCESSLPDKTMFTFQARDPRLANRTKPRPPKDSSPIDTIIDMKTTKSNLNPQVINSLLTSEGRTASYDGQLSLKQIAQEKNKDTAERTKGPPIPVVVFNSNGTWTVLLPWHWVLPVWHALNHIAHVKLGGLMQTHQLAFEKGQLFFPTDFPFTEAGDLENKMTMDVKKEKWNKKPMSKKVNYAKVKLCEGDYAKGELGDPHGCDWRYLQVLRLGLTHVKTEANTRTSKWVDFQRQIEELHDVYNFIEDVKQGKTKSSALPVTLSKGSATYPATVEAPLPVTPVRFESVGRGNMLDNARVYAIPPNDLDKWMKSLKIKDTQGRAVHEYPAVPHSKYLIGFITGAAYNLTEGKNTGVGCIDAVWAQTGEKYVLVRNVGTDYARVAKWDAVEL